MKKTQILVAVYTIALLFMTTSVKASLIISVTENSTLGGTNWGFSVGTGSVGGSGQHFLVGGTVANPQLFYSTNDENIGGLAVLSGTNDFNINNIVVRNYGGLLGTNGNIFDGLDFQTSGGSIGGLSIGLLNGLVLHAGSFDISSLNIGTYNLDSFYRGYNTNLGSVTLNVGDVATVPVPAAVWLFGSGLIGLVGMRKKASKVTTFSAQLKNPRVKVNPELWTRPKKSVESVGVKPYI